MLKVEAIKKFKEYEEAELTIKSGNKVVKQIIQASVSLLKQDGHYRLEGKIKPNAPIMEALNNYRVSGIEPTFTLEGCARSKDGRFEVEATIWIDYDVTNPYEFDTRNSVPEVSDECL